MPIPFKDRFNVCLEGSLDETLSFLLLTPPRMGENRISTVQLDRGVKF